MTFPWHTVMTKRVTRDGSDPHNSNNGVVIRDTAENFRIMFASEFGRLLKSTGWHDYSGPTISVNKYFQSANWPTPAGILAWKELGY